MNHAATLLVGACVFASAVVARPLRAEGDAAFAIRDSLLASLVGEALDNNPALKAAREAAAAARSRPAQARSLPDPMFVVSYTNDGVSPTLGSRDMTTLAFMWGQELPYSGKRGLRGDFFLRAADQADQQVERVKLGLTAAVEHAYYDLLVSRELLELVQEQEEIWRQTEGIVRARYAVGRGSQQDVLRSQVEVVRIERMRIERETEAEIQVAEINQLLGRPAGTPLATEARLVLRSVDESMELLLARLEASSPELNSAALGVSRSKLGVELARKEYRPDFALQGGYMNRGGLDPMWVAGVGISIPLYRERLESGLAEAQSQTRSGEQLVEWLRLMLRFRTEERLAQLEATAEIAGLYRDGILPQDRLAVDAAMASYQTGQVPFVTVLEALTTLYDDLATHLQVLANHAKIRASLEEASLEQTTSLTIGGVTSPAVGTSMSTMAGAMSGDGTASRSGSMTNR
ncbi:MAG TPA: TolC family protein [Vicinamibacteria bacterium]|nr:TolC family protein [Vicinamibacteria bacterium]